MIELTEQRFDPAANKLRASDEFSVRISDLNAKWEEMVDGQER